MDQALGDHDASHARLERTLAELPDGASRESVDLMLALAVDSFFRKDLPRMQQWGRRAVDLAAEWGDLPRLAAAHGAEAMALALSAEVAAAETQLAAAVDLVDRMTDEEVAGRVDALGSIAGAELYLDRYLEAVTHAERGLRIARATGTLALVPTLVPTLGTSLWVVGRMADSLRVIEECTEAARAARDRQGTAWQLFNLAYAQRNQGDLDAALQSSTESLEIARDLGDSFVTSWSGAIAAAVRLELGDPTAALRILDETSGGPGLETLPGGWRCHFFEVATRAWLDLDRPDRAQETAERSLAWGAAVGLPHGQCTAARGMARWALARGDAATAVAQASAAVDYAERATARYDAAISRIVLGQALRLADRRDDAVAELREAASHLDAMGALRYRDEAERELGRLGSRPHRRTAPGAGDSGLTALTRRELEVARLVVDRRTNPEIAATLFLSIKTVETHLRNIFRKLDVESRADLARVLEAAVVSDPTGARQ
jgi:DNA-binding CsgD family transcriptional regulator